jgi:hypothetical protein
VCEIPVDPGCVAGELRSDHGHVAVAVTVHVDVEER